MSHIDREFTRQRTLLPAKILFNNKQSVFDCVVKNFSSGGAHLRIASRLGIPDHFTLHIPSYDKQFLCWVVWGETNEMGVSFSPRRHHTGKPDLRIVEDE